MKTKDKRVINKFLNSFIICAIVIYSLNMVVGCFAVGEIKTSILETMESTKRILEVASILVNILISMLLLILLVIPGLKDVEAKKEQAKMKTFLKIIISILILVILISIEKFFAPGTVNFFYK